MNNVAILRFIYYIQILFYKDQKILYDSLITLVSFLILHFYVSWQPELTLTLKRVIEMGAVGLSRN